MWKLYETVLTLPFSNSLSSSYTHTKKFKADQEGLNKYYVVTVRHVSLVLKLQ